VRKVLQLFIAKVTAFLPQWLPFMPKRINTESN
jgi:hypothetical protein